jgi:DNA-binding NarL/FixJ family response regulator
VPLRVLIVDDNQSFLDAARSLLERQNMQVVDVALTGAEAVRGADQLRPDVVLVDITLAGESGFELARRLVGRDHGSGPAVILISTHAQEDLADLIAESPAAGFVSKCDLSAEAILSVLDGGPP